MTEWQPAKLEVAPTKELIKISDGSLSASEKSEELNSSERLRRYEERRLEKERKRKQQKR